MAVGEARRWFDRSRSRTAAGSGRLIAPPALFLLLILLLLFSMLLALGIGSFSISPGESVAILLDRAHALHRTQEILSSLHLPWSAAPAIARLPPTIAASSTRGRRIAHSTADCCSVNDASQ